MAKGTNSTDGGANLGFEAKLFLVTDKLRGSMQFGERTLGNRSILGDPRDEIIKDKINKSTKCRETFRPFAPAILAEKVCEVFDVEKNFKCQFMVKELVTI